MIAPCRRLAEAMTANGLPKGKVIILPHGIPLPKAVPHFPPVTEGGVRFFYVGRISYVKGLHTLLEAFHRLDAPRAEYRGGAREAMEQYCAEQMAAQDYNRSVTVRFRCTVNERNRIEQLAAREGKTISEFIRDRCTAD